MPSLSIYENKCVTLDQDISKAGWLTAISRLGREWSKISSEKEELAKDGVYITSKEDLSEFTVMILKEKDSGPYNFIPFIFTIKPCKEKETGKLYPLIPPIVRFHSFNNQYIHPNFKSSGDVCISLLEYSYIGDEIAQWNPSIGIKSIAITLSSLLIEGALRNEPGYNNESLTSIRCIDYDNGAEYICMNYLLDQLDREDILFKDVIMDKRTDILDYIISKVLDRKDFDIKTYAFEIKSNFAKLYERAIKLAHNDPHSS
jgi:ubiquitin-protein ligase